MSDECWAVKDARGEDLGTIKKFIIDSKTRQISYAEIVLTHTKQLVRVPWCVFEVTDGLIRLKTTEPFPAAPSHSDNAASPDGVIVEVARAVPGKIRHQHQTMIAEAASTRFEHESV